MNTKIIKTQNFHKMQYGVNLKITQVHSSVLEKVVLFVLYSDLLILLQP